jgi:phosphoesterase RecJ-like protein
MKDMDLNLLTNTLLESLDHPGSIAITSHIHPDGDGFCAALALQRWLLCKGRSADIITDADDLDRFAHLMQDSVVIEYREVMRYDQVFVLDCNTQTRLGKRYDLVSRAKRSVLIDHHEVENLPITADHIFIVPEYVSVGAMLFDALHEDILQLAEPDRIYIGNCLYTTILNDTNNFTNANTTPEVFAVSEGMARLGIKPNELYKAYFLNHTHQEMRFVGEVLSTIEVLFESRVLFIDSSLEMQRRNKVNAEAILNITRWVQGLRGIDVVVYFREEQPGLYKLSLRSVMLDVNEIAVAYGGGGHRNAAGCHLKGSLSEVKDQIVRHLEPLMENITPNA